MSLELLYDEKEMYLFLKNYCEKKKYVNALRALDYAIVHHEGQFRKGNGMPYITHPMAVAYFLILSGIENDNAIAVSFLHDVPEDCGTDLSDLNVNADIKHSANILNWKQYKAKYADRNLAMMLYYNDISKDIWATLNKFSDRSHNLFTMRGAFTKEKMMDYVKETNTYYPYLFQQAYQRYPNVIFSIQYFQQQIENLIQAYEENDFSNLDSNFEQNLILPYNKAMYVPDKKIIILPQSDDRARKRILVS